MTQMTRKERLAWRRIERSLRAEAPHLTRLSMELDAARPDLSWAWVGFILLVMAVPLIVAGTAMGEAEMVYGGLLVATTLPPLVALVWLANRRVRS